MRVLVLTADLPPHVHSGIGTAVAASVQALATQGCDIEVLTTAADPSVPGVSVTRLGAQSFPERLRGAQVIHVHSLALADLAWELKKRDGSALLYTAHSLLARELENSRTSEPWLNKQMQLLERADHVIFLSYAERSAAVRFCPSVAKRSTVVPNAIGRALPTRPQREGPPLVLFAGRFCWSKGIDVATGAMEMLLQKSDEVNCVLVGGHGEPRFLQLVRELVRRYPRRCFAPGWLTQADLQTWLARASMLIMPSRYEPFGMMALEALRSGVPVLGAKIEGLSEILAENSGAAAVAGHRPENWARAVEALVHDPHRMQQMRACGPGYVQSRFGLTEHGERYLRALRRCVADCSAQSATSPSARRAA